MARDGNARRCRAKTCGTSIQPRTGAWEACSLGELILLAAVVCRHFDGPGAACRSAAVHCAPGAVF
jgi:hypothetical protein